MVRLHTYRQCCTPISSIWLKGLWNSSFCITGLFHDAWFLKLKQERTPIIFSSCCKYHVCDISSKTGRWNALYWNLHSVEEASCRELNLSMWHSVFFFFSCKSAYLRASITQLTSIPEKWTHVQDQWNGGIPLTVRVTEPVLYNMRFYGQNCNLSLQPAKGQTFIVDRIRQLSGTCGKLSNVCTQPGHYLHSTYFGS